MQTSNSVHIVQPDVSESGGEEFIPQHGIAAIAQCTSVLEIPGIMSESALSYLKTTLPVYSGVTEQQSLSSQGLSRRKAYDDIPLSNAEVDDAWKEVCAFELDDGRKCYQPSAKAILRTWTELGSLAAIEKINLAKAIPLHSVKKMLDSMEDCPRSLGQALLDNLATPVNDHISLDMNRTLTLIGSSLIEDLEEFGRSDFMAQWKALVPDQWVSGVSIDLLADVWEPMTGTNTIRLRNAPSKTSSSKAEPAATGKRKWHEKFKQARNK